jgi:UDP-glucose 4-epimerase
VNILVTGGSGQLGSYLFEALGRDHEVWGVDIRGPVLSGQKGRVDLGDIRDTEAMTKECSGADIVIHTAAQVSVQKSTDDPSLDADLNVLGTISMLKAAQRSGVKSFVYLSSAAVYGDPQYVPVDERHPTEPKSFYGTSKLSAEHYVRSFRSTFGLNYIIVRPFNFYSPRADHKSPYSGVITKFIQNAKEGRKLFIEGDGLQTRDFLHAADVARMLRLAVESEVRDVILNCGSGRGTSINELAETVASIAPNKVSIEHLAPRTSDIRHSVAVVSRAYELLGFRTEISLKEGLRTFFA